MLATLAQRHAALCAAFSPLLDNPSWMLEHLMARGKVLPLFPAEQRQARYQVAGCMSHVWLLPAWPAGRLALQADSDAATTKGLAALLVELFMGATPQEVLGWQGNLVQTLGLATLLGAQRTSGVDAMVRHLQVDAQQALALQSKSKARTFGPS